MLTFDRSLHAGIKEGNITLTFRYWDRPPISAGRRYHCGDLGDVLVEEVTPVRLSEVTAAEAAAAGAASVEALHQRFYARNVKARADGDHAYRVRFRYLGNDAQRVREGRITEEDLRRLDRQLATIDVKSYEGEWTQFYIAVLTQKKWMRPGEVAQNVGTDQDTVRRKMNILADLGLVRVDHGLGYTLSLGGRRLYAYRLRG